MQLGHLAEDLLRKLLARELSQSSGITAAPGNESASSAAEVEAVVDEAVTVVESLAAQLALLDSDGHMRRNFLNEIGMLPDSELVTRVRAALAP